MGRTRNSSLDLFRIILMFGICWLHAETQGGYNHAWLGNLLSCAVPGFVFISGYFGVKFSVGRVLGLYAQALYGAVAYLLFQYLTLDGPISLAETWKLIRWLWFLHAYVFLMCMAPLLDRAVAGNNSRDILKVVMPFLFLSFGWSFALKFPFVGGMLPKTPGLGGFTGLTLCGVYLVARLYRLLDLGQYLTWKRIGVLLPLAAGLVCVGFGGYNSPFSCLLVALLFWMFERAHLPQTVSQVCLAIAPSMFGIYVIHGHGMAWPYFRELENWFVVQHGIWWGLSQFVTGMIVFGICLVMDIPRRGFVGLIRRCSRK